MHRNPKRSVLLLALFLAAFVGPACTGGESSSPASAIPDASCPTCTGDPASDPPCSEATLFLCEQDPLYLLFSDSTHLYWKSSGSTDEFGNRFPGPLMRMAFSDESIESIEEGFGDAYGFKQDETHIYWVDEPTIGNHRILRAPKSDLSGQDILVETESLPRLYTNDTSLFWSQRQEDNTWRIFVSMKDGTAPEELLPAPLPAFSTHLADNTHFYWTEESQNSIYRAPLDDITAIETLSDDAWFPALITVQDSTLYAMDGDGGFTVVAYNVESQQSLNIAQHECNNQQAHIGAHRGYLFCESQGSARTWELFAFAKTPGSPTSLATTGKRGIAGLAEGNGYIWWAQNADGEGKTGSLHRVAVANE